MPAWFDELSLRPGPPWHGMGTRGEAAPAPWSSDPMQLAEKRRLLATVRDEVVVSLPGSDAAALDAARFVRAGAGDLVEAATSVAEDLCVLTRDERQWRFVAGVVCFPSRWRPLDKLGRPVAEIHGPVPAYAAELASQVDRFLDALRPGRGAWRRNWFVHDDPALHQPVPPPTADVEIPGGLWLRSERQSLHALPATGAVLFTIRTEQVPLAELAARPEVATAMAAALRAWSPELVAYRGAGPWHAAVLEWLDGP